jgi:DNA-binding beta-propeller fold protein YncE
MGNRTWKVLGVLCALMVLCAPGWARPTLLRTVPLVGARDVAVNPITNRIYVTRTSANLVAVLNGADSSVMANITVDSRSMSR